MILSVAFIFAAIWTFKAAAGRKSKSLAIGCAIAFLLFSQLIPSALETGTGFVVSLVAGVACIALVISLGSRFRSDAMKAVIEGEEEPRVRA